MWFDVLEKSISTFGPDIDALIWLIWYVTAFFFVVMLGLLAYFLVTYRRNRPGPAEYLPADKPRDWSWLLALGAVVLLIDLVIEGMGAKAWAKIKEDMPENSPVHIQVTAQQFSWDIVYPGKDGQLNTPDDLHSMGELHVPVNTKVRLDLRSRDVIHSLFLPDARFKQDLMPGREIPAWIEITQIGESRLFCAELCGTAHTAMIGKLVAHEPREFQAWLIDLAKQQ